MSLLRACTQAVSRPSISRPLAAPLRHVSSEVKAPEQSRPKTGEPVEITPMPEKDVVAADAISGAPGASNLSDINQIITLIILNVIVGFSSTPPPPGPDIPTREEHDAERLRKD